MLFSGIVCGPAALLASGYLLRGWLVTAAGLAEANDDAPVGRAHRRRLGAALVLMVSVVFFVGTNYLDPQRDSIAYLAIWLLVLAQVGWLVWLALQDMRQTMREHRLSRKNLRKDADSWPESRKGS